MSIIRSAGSSFPVSASLVQLQSEITDAEFEKRLDALSDPISTLHEDIPTLAEILYAKIKESDSTRMQFEDEFYEKYSRPLAALEATGQIRGSHAAGQAFGVGFRVIDPSFVTYMAYRFENSENMEKAHSIIDGCAKGTWLDGKKISAEAKVPIPVVRAMFQIYEAKGYGLMSQEVGSCAYVAQA